MRGSSGVSLAAARRPGRPHRAAHGVMPGSDVLSPREMRLPDPYCVVGAGIGSKGAVSGGPALGFQGRGSERQRGWLRWPWPSRCPREKAPRTGSLRGSPLPSHRCRSHERADRVLAGTWSSSKAGVWPSAVETLASRSDASAASSRARHPSPPASAIGEWRSRPEHGRAAVRAALPRTRARSRLSRRGSGARRRRTRRPVPQARGCSPAPVD